MCITTGFLIKWTDLGADCWDTIFQQFFHVLITVHCLLYVTPLQLQFFLVFFIFSMVYFYFEFQQLYSQWQGSKDSNKKPVRRLRKCNPYYIRPRLCSLFNKPSWTISCTFGWVNRGLHRLAITLTVSRVSTTLSPVDHRCSQSDSNHRPRASRTSLRH